MKKEDEEDYEELTDNDLLSVNYDISRLAFADIEDCLEELHHVSRFIYKYKDEIIEMIA